MDRSQLIEVLAKAEGFTAKKAKAGVETLFEAIAKALEEGDRVEIRGLCAFKVKEYRPYRGRNPKTGEAIAVGNKKLPFFKPGRELKELVDS